MDHTAQNIKNIIGECAVNTKLIFLLEIIPQNKLIYVIDILVE